MTPRIGITKCVDFPLPCLGAAPRAPTPPIGTSQKGYSHYNPYQVGPTNVLRTFTQAAVPAASLPE